MAAVTEAETVGALADLVLAGAPARLALAGLSMGGIVAMEIAARAPDRLAGLALLDTNPRAETPERQSLRALQIARALAGGLAEIMRDEMKPHYLADGPRKAEILDLCMAMALDLGPEVFRRQSLALRDRPAQTRLDQVAVPTTILVGRHDRLCPIERHEEMHRQIPGATLTILDQAGHLPTLESPEATNAALGAWYSRI